MITEDQLREAFHAAADDLTPPPEGPAAVRRAARGGAAAAPASFDGAQLLRRRRRLLELAVAAAVVLVVGGVSAFVVTSHGAPKTTFGSAIGSSGAAVLPAEGSPVAHAPVAGLQSNAQGLISAAAPAAKAAGGTSGTASSSGVPAKIASSGHLTIGIGRAALNHDVSTLRSLATKAGGYVAATDVNEATKTGQGSLTLSVPASAFPMTISSAEHLGTVRTLVTKANDVTGQYNNTAAQLQALGAVRAQLETLLGRATKVSDLLAVEAQIEQTQTQIDELQATQRSLNQEITYATLTVDLQLRSTTHHASHPSALSRAWSDAISGFTGGLKWLLSISGALLFSLLLAIGLGLLARLGWRRYGPRLRRHFL